MQRDRYFHSALPWLLVFYFLFILGFARYFTGPGSDFLLQSHYTTLLYFTHCSDFSFGQQLERQKEASASPKWPGAGSQAVLTGHPSSQAETDSFANEQPKLSVHGLRDGKSLQDNLLVPLCAALQMFLSWSVHRGEAPKHINKIV